MAGLLDTGAQMQATPRTNRFAGLLADALGAVDGFARKPFGYDNPPAGLLSDALAVPQVQRTLERLSYGEPLTTGKGQATALRPDTVDAALAVAPVVAKWPKQAGGLLAAVAGGGVGPDDAMRSMILYHGTNYPKALREIGTAENGVIDGLFTSPSRQAASSFGDNLYRVTIPDAQIAGVDLSRALDDAAEPARSHALSVLAQRTNGNQRVADAILGGRGDVVYGPGEIDAGMLQNALQSARSSDLHDLSWEAQNIRGHVAEALGFRAVAMPDETGVSYLVLPGSAKPRPVSESAKRVFRGEAPSGSPHVIEKPAPPDYLVRAYAEASKLDASLNGRRRATTEAGRNAQREANRLSIELLKYRQAP